jgi:hypothetical protein
MAAAGYSICDGGENHGLAGRLQTHHGVEQIPISLGEPNPVMPGLAVWRDAAKLRNH